VWVSDCLSTLLVPISEFQHALLPLKCCESGNVPQLLTFLLFSPQTHIWNLSRSLGACQRGFVVRNQTPNLTLDPFFAHLYSCISSLNGQCKVILNIDTSKKIQWYIGDPIWCLFALSTKNFKHLGFMHKCNSQSGSEVGNHWAPSFSLSLIYESVSHPNTLSWPHGLLHSTLSHELNVRVTTIGTFGF
jgi:hypothetical protein